MTKHELETALDKLSKDLFFVSRELDILKAKLELNMDKKAMSEIITDIHWAEENLTVLGLHQIGEALDDNCGTGLND